MHPDGEINREQRSFALAIIPFLFIISFRCYLHTRNLKFEEDSYGGVQVKSVMGCEISRAVHRDTEIKKCNSSYSPPLQLNSCIFK